jgi:DNA polymerase (family 10)
MAGLPLPVSELAAADRLRLAGIGPAIDRVVAEHLEHGASSYLADLRAGEPPGVGQLVQVMGVSAAVARALAGRGVTDLAGLAAAVTDGSVREVPGVGERTAEVIADGIGRLELVADGRPVLRAARLEAEGWARDVAALDGVDRVEVAGDVRRGVPRPAALHLVAVLAPAADPTAVARAVLTAEGSLRPLCPVGCACPACAEGAHPPGGLAAALELLTTRGRRLGVHLTAPAAAGTALVEATGSAGHVAWLRERGLAADAADEVAAYRSAGLAVVPPPLRELDAPPAPGRLVELADLRGDGHVHTEWSGDGHDPIDELARAATARGYDWIAFTDHAVDLTMNGLTREALRRRDAAIEAARDRHPDLVLLRGLELNIGLDGGLDYDLETLLGQDWCVASIHSVFQRPAAVQTERILAAVAHPAVDAIGHPVGRLLGRRPGYAIDVTAIAQAAAETGTALEVNGSPLRLDLDAELVAIAVAAGAPLVLSSDAHRARELDYVTEAVLTAQRGGAPVDLVRNAGDPPARGPTG